MNPQLCDICKTETAIIHIEGRGDYCLKCHNEVMLERFGIDDTYNYAEYMSVAEPNKTFHIFKISHIILGDIVSWEAVEQGGDYNFKLVSSVGQNGTEVAKRFFKKIVNGVLTKSLNEHAMQFANVLKKDDCCYSLKDKGNISIVESDDDPSTAEFIIDGKRFSAADFGKLLGPHIGSNILFKIQDESETLLYENDYLEPVTVSVESLIGELKTAIAIFCDARGFLSYKKIVEFDELFFPITDKLEILMKSSHREEAKQAGRTMIELLEEIDTDDDFFPDFECNLIRRAIER